MSNSLTIYLQSPKDMQKIYHTPMSLESDLESMETWSNFGEDYDDLSGGVDLLTNIKQIRNVVDTSHADDHWTYKVVGIAQDIMFIVSGICMDEPKALNAVNPMCRLMPTNVWVKYGHQTACCDVMTMNRNFVPNGNIVQTPLTLSNGVVARFCGDDGYTVDDTCFGELVPAKYSSPYFTSRDAYQIADYSSLTVKSLQEATTDHEFNQALHNYESIQKNIVGNDSAIIKQCLDGLFYRPYAKVGDLKAAYPFMNEVEIQIPRTPQYDVRGMINDVPALAESTIAYTMPYLMSSCGIVDISFRYVSTERVRKLSCPFHLHFLHPSGNNSSTRDIAVAWERFQNAYNLVLASYVVGQVGEHDVTVVSGIGTQTSVNLTSKDVHTDPGFVEFDNHIASNHSPAVVDASSHSSSQYGFQSIVDLGFYFENGGACDG